METKEITFKVKFVASSVDFMGYINYVFEDLVCTDPDYKYIMCVRFPNWDQAPFDIGDIGFVTVRYVREGVDKWFDGTNLVPYKYTNIVFLKYIPLKPESESSEILVD